MKTLFLFVMLASGIGQCSESTVGPTSDALVIRSGTSFGMCLGYCKREMEVNGTKATFTQTSPQDPAKYPAKLCQKTLPTNKAESLVSLASFTNFRKLPKSIGCPDCADGGAEYVEMEQGGVKHRVTFEYGRTIPGFESLVDNLRAQRQQFDTCN